MAHEINKANMINDIILTISLAISVIIVKAVMYMTNIDTHEYEGMIFFIASFIMVKITYFSLTKLAHKKFKVFKLGYES